MPKCYFCKKEVSDDYYCYGCDEYVCDDCDKEPELGEDHEVEDHR